MQVARLHLASVWVLLLHHMSGLFRRELAWVLIVVRFDLHVAKLLLHGQPESARLVAQEAGMDEVLKKLRAFGGEH